VSARDRAADLVAKTMNVLHGAVLTLSGGRVLRKAFGMPVVQLHTTGRKSGQRRSVMLTTPVRDGETYVLVASKGGDDRHPDWYHNVVAQPDVEVTENGVTKPMRARTASADEKAELWPRIVAAYKGYAGYQKRTQRDIPVVLLEPRS
jgi:deazaflavin-dependent oxidoreductase (nitroreductase family)